MSGQPPKGAVDRGGLSSVVALVSAFVSHNSVPQAELPGFIASVQKALSEVVGGRPRSAEEPVAKGPAVPVRKSVTQEFIICLEDGGKFRSLKRHLTTHGLTPDTYRAKWGLADDYPMVAPAYAAKRSDLAKQAGLGLKRKQAAAKGKAARRPAADKVDPATPPV